MNPIIYKGAILIIGSLYWDNDSRAQWRNDRLDLDNKIFVQAPIRYGRISGGKRKNTYTMVFSLSCYEDGLGTAILAPLLYDIKGLSDLRLEAEKLWQAERGLQNRIFGSWGAVGLLINPATGFPDDLLDGWKEYYDRYIHISDFSIVENESPVISQNGLLSIEWIKDNNDCHSVEYDFILATATIPSSQQYPSANDIAQACIDNQYPDYINNNIENGITTFQDSEIKENLEVLSRGK